MFNIFAKKMKENNSKKITYEGGKRYELGKMESLERDGYFF